jgi:hypothetical protein
MFPLPIMWLFENDNLDAAFGNMDAINVLSRITNNSFYGEKNLFMHIFLVH